MTLQGQTVEAATQPWFLALLFIVVGWALGLIGALCLDRQRDRRRLDAERANFAGAIAAELEGLLRRYRQIGGDQLGQAQTPAQFPGGLLVRFNYFAVYDANLSKIGLLRPDDATRLVFTYILAKGHMDDLITWGEVILPSQVQTTIQTFFGGLKRDHDQLMQSVPQIVTLLRGYTPSVVQR